MRKLGVALAILVTLLFAGTLVYFMPRATMARITGTDVKRMDKTDMAGGEGATRDVRFVYATELDSQKARVFRNEDTAWYLKWNSGDIAAEASKLAAAEGGKIALVKYYGIRMAIFDSYPNILSLKEVGADYVYVPWVNMIVLLVLLFFVIWAGVKIRRTFRSAKAKFSGRPPAS
jgi:hypothetical protein